MILCPAGHATRNSSCSRNKFASCGTRFSPSVMPELTEPAPVPGPFVPASPALLIEDSAVARHIFKHLDPEDLLMGASLVSKQWRRHTKPLCAEWKQELLAGETTLNVSGLC